MESKLSIRVPAPLRQRLEALAKAPPTSMAYRGTVKLSTLVREALARGLEDLEREVQPKPIKFLPA